MTDILIKKIDDVYIKIECEESISFELQEFFSFKAPEYWFNPLYKAKRWDGVIRLFSTYSKKLYSGLLPYVIKFAKNNRYDIIIDPKLKITKDNYLSPEETKKFVSSLDPHTLDKSNNEYEKISARDYQLWAIWSNIKNKRGIVVCPTSSGKSLMIYALTRYIQKNINKKILIIVPTIGLVTQMYNDFGEYSYSDKNWFPDDQVHKITAGEKKYTNKSILISTWQSIYKMKKDYFKQFGAVIGDECHLFKAKSLIHIMTKLIACPWRIGFTGTLGSKTINKLVLQGLFGKSKKIMTTEELMERKEVANLNIQCINLKYNDAEKKALMRKKYINKTGKIIIKQAEYQDEIKFITEHEKRNKFITNLVLSKKKNSLVLIQKIKHGENLFEMIKKKSPNRKIYLVNGGTDKKDREKIRILAEKENEVIIIASYGVFSTGVSIKNIFNVVFGSPSKSEFRVLQSIGRGLRISATKSDVTLFDIIDDLSWKKKINYSLKHFIERIKIYNSEKFNYRLFNIDL